MGDPALQLGVHPGVQRLPGRLRRRATGTASSRSRRCRSGTSTRPSPRSSAAPASGTRGSCSPRTPGTSACPSSPTGSGTRCGARPRRRACRSTSTSPRATSTRSASDTPTTARTPTTRRWACRSSWRNAKTIAQLITGGICHRFPDLDFVSVESGIGWIPFALAALDWQWQNCGVPAEHPEYDLLPSEYFRRQIYGCFWFERDTAAHGDRAARRRQRPVRDRLPAPDEHVARPGQRRASARTTSSQAVFADLPLDDDGARSSTTTPPASTTSTEPTL